MFLGEKNLLTTFLKPRCKKEGWYSATRDISFLQPVLFNSFLTTYTISLLLTQFEFPHLLAKFADNFLKKRNINEIPSRRNRIQMAKLLGRKTGL